MTQQEAAACLIIALIHDEDENKNRRKTRNWIKKREQYGLYANLVQELRAEDTNAYKEMMRMDFNSFEEILRYLKNVFAEPR